jgi:pimeloyl-ACP methyl ester carboxylesterase
VRLRHGREDRAVPVENGELLAARLPDVQAEFDDGGHQDVLFRDPEPDFRWLSSL